MMILNCIYCYRLVLYYYVFLKTLKNWVKAIKNVKLKFKFDKKLSKNRLFI